MYLEKYMPYIQSLKHSEVMDFSKLFSNFFLSTFSVLLTVTQRNLLCCNQYTEMGLKKI